MKRIISIISVIAIIILSFAACSKGGSSGEIVSMYDLSKAMMEAGKFDDMTYISSEDKGAENLLGYVSDISYEKVHSFFVSYAKDGKGNADEIAVIAVKNKADTNEALASLKQHQEKRRSTYATYDPSQTDKVASGIGFSIDCYAVLIICDNPKAVKTAFEEFISGASDS